MQVKEYRQGRNFIRVGDIVKVAPTAPKKRDGFEAVVQAIEADDEGNPTIVQLVGGSRGRCMTRFVRPERLRRVAQVRGGERRERKR